MAFDFINDALTERRDQSLFRERTEIGSKQGREIVVNGKRFLNFSSNDYLGLASSEELEIALSDGAKLFGAGSAGSPLLNGYMSAHRELEQSIKEWMLHGENKSTNKSANTSLNTTHALTSQNVADDYDVMLFSSGFAANNGVIQALMNDTDSLIVQDKLNHASLIESAANVNAKSVRYKHNDVAHLKQRLSKDCSKTLVVTEGVFSMDGDTGYLPDIAKQLTQRDKQWLMVDDAHGIGVLGDKGRGTASHFNLPISCVDITMGTFGKAIGTSGAYVFAKKNVIDYLVNFSRHYIYSTSMSPAIAYTTSQSIQLIQSQSWRQERLHELIQYFKGKMKTTGLQLLPSDSAIQPIVLNDAASAVHVSALLKSQGIWSAAIRPPTVPNGTSRLRVTLTANHTNGDIDCLIGGLISATKELSTLNVKKSLNA